MELGKSIALLTATLATQKATPYKSALVEVLAVATLQDINLTPEAELDVLIKQYRVGRFTCFGVTEHSVGYKYDNTACRNGCDRKVECRRATELYIQIEEAKCT